MAWASTRGRRRKRSCAANASARQRTRFGGPRSRYHDERATPPIVTGAAHPVARADAGLGKNRGGRAGPPVCHGPLGRCRTRRSAGRSRHARAMTSPPDRKDIGRTPQRPGDATRTTGRATPVPGRSRDRELAWSVRTGRIQGNCRRPVDGDGGRIAVAGRWASPRLPGAGHAPTVSVHQLVTCWHSSWIGAGQGRLDREMSRSGRS